MLRLMGLPPVGAFPDVTLESDDVGLLLRFSGAEGERMVDIPAWTLAGQDRETVELWLLATLQERGYRASLAG
jgi:hypothetical protein